MKDNGRQGGLLYHAAGEKLPHVVQELLRLRVDVDVESVRGNATSSPGRLTKFLTIH